MKQLELGKDYWLEDGLVVFSREYLLRRGYCCNKRCKHCPYVESREKVIID
jgi:hypothetical protein